MAQPIQPTEDQHLPCFVLLHIDPEGDEPVTTDDVAQILNQLANHNVCFNLTMIPLARAYDVARMLDEPFRAILPVERRS